MPFAAADRIRNVALVGHRGSGKTSLMEALMFEAGATTRLGSVADGSTISDSDEDEKSRGMSISASLASFDWRGAKVNLIDTPGEPSFVADALGALRVCESAVFVVNAVMGVEVSTQRLWQRAADLGVARLVYVNMLDRERADFFRTLESLKTAFGPHVVATEIPIGSEHEIRGLIDLVDMKAYEYDGAGKDNCREIPIPDDLQAVAEEYREKLMDEVAENSEALMERYLEGDDISHDEIVQALEDGTEHGHIFPVTCGVATGHLGTDRLLDALVEDLPSPAQHGALALDDVTLAPDADAEMFAYVFKTRADPFAGRVNLFRVYQGTLDHDTQVMNTRTHHKERVGTLLVPHGKEMAHADAFGPGDIGAVAKLKETKAGDWLAARDQPIEMPSIQLPAPVMAFAIEPAHRGDEEKVYTSLHRLQEEDPTIDLHRDAQTGEQIVAGLSQLHVEVIVERLKSRFGVEVTLKPPRVPYQETIRGHATAHGRHKKQTGGRGQFGDCHIRIEACDQDFEFVNEIKGGVIPHGFIPAVEKGVREAMEAGAIAGYPVKGVRVRLFDGSYHSVDSSEMAFKLAGSLAMREAMSNAQPALLEPIMLVTVSTPDDHVGDVMGDLSSRRGRPLGHRGGRRHDRGQGRGADGGDAVLRARPAVADRRTGRVHDGVRALRGAAAAPGAEGRRGERRGSRRGRGLATRRSRSRRGLPLLPSAAPCRPFHTRDIKTNRADVICDVCGRTLLRGERIEPFLAAGQRRQVCELCTVRATHEGWIREAGADELTTPTTRPDRGRSLIGRLFGGRERTPEPEEPEPDEELDPAIAAELEDHPVVTERRPPRPPQLVPEIHREPRHVRAVPTNAQLKMERAIDVFNASDHPRTVAGVARSLGSPEVCVRTSEDEPSVVSLFVMWELSWYRYEVDLSDEAGGARRVAQGAELAELDERDRAVNATADERGRVALAG